MSLQNILVYVLVGFLSLSNVYNEHNEFYCDKNSYFQVANTVIYTDKDIRPKELDDIVTYYNMLPTGVLHQLNENDIHIYLIKYKEGNNIKYYNDTPIFIERDSSDIRNLKTIVKDNENFLVYHGIHIGPLKSTDIDWSYWTEKYVRESSLYGADYFSYENKVDTNNEYGYITVPLKNKDNLYEHKGNVYYYIDSVDYKPEFILHEVGLKFDALVGLNQTGTQSQGISKQQSWIDLYNEYAPIMDEFDDLSKQKVPLNAESGFAEAFRLTVQYSINFKEVCPEVYDFVVNQIQLYGSLVTEENFNYKGYSDRYDDIKIAFGYNKELLYKHYIEYGLVEGRIG